MDKVEQKKDYVDIVYNTDDRPFTPYPDQMTKHLCDRFSLKSGNSILDYGCGRGEFTHGFVKQGLKASAIDISDYITKTYSDIPFKSCDMLNDPFPFEDNTFDHTYSKSVIEHFYYPEKIMSEVFRVLKPGGTGVVLTPDWEVIYKMFYEDYTHRTPFTKTSLEDFMTISGFEDVKVEKFVQLPSVWESQLSYYLSRITAAICPDIMKSRSKWIRFSKEMMLLGYGRKPE